MMMTSWREIWYGTLTVQFRGDEVNEVLSALQQKRIQLRSIIVRNHQCQCMFCLKDFPEVYAICKKFHVKMRFLDRSGIPFWWKRAYHRKAFFLGIGLFCCLLYLFSNMIWQVQVQGVSDDDLSQSLMQTAREFGLYAGAWKWRLPDVVELQKDILEKSPHLVWVGVSIEGAVAKIQAIEKINPPDAIATTPHSIVAAKPGVIRHVYASRGHVQVLPGQFVQPGQVIISGELGEGNKAVPANGQVLAEVWYVSKVQVPLVTKQQTFSGVFVTREYLDIGGFHLRIWGWKQPHYSAFLERDENQALTLGHLKLPIQFRKVTEYEVNVSMEQHSLERAKQEALQMAHTDVQTQVGKDGRILAQTVLHPEVLHGTLYETILTRTEENIGVPEIISEPQPHGENPNGNHDSIQ